MRQIRLIIAALLILGPYAAYADIIFTFEETGGTVIMTSAGVLDTNNLIVSGLPDGWGGTGTEHNGAEGDIDIMGGTTFGSVDINYGFSVGTDASAITNTGGIGGPFAFSNFDALVSAGSKSFTTYAGFSGPLRLAGVGMRSADIVGGLWTPDQNWTYVAGTTFAALGLNIGTYAVSDLITGETITIQIGAVSVPEPGTLALLSIGLFSMGLARRRKNV